LFVFVDGLGLGSEDPALNPLADTTRFPCLGDLLRRARPLDATLGVSGLPQSATGQAALLTGLNAPALMGRHIEGFPPPRLRDLVREHNLFSKLRNAGKTCTFANAYWTDTPTEPLPRFISVTTAATLSAFGAVRGREELLADRAVYHDLTRTALRERGYTGPLLSPEAAAEHLIALAASHEFTLFEFFETDRAGHSGDHTAVFPVWKNSTASSGHCAPSTARSSSPAITATLRISLCAVTPPIRCRWWRPMFLRS
jgi:hypothetical protein